MAPKAQVSGAQRFLFRSKYDSSYATFTPTLAYLWYLVTVLYVVGLKIANFFGGGNTDRNWLTKNNRYRIDVLRPM